MTNPKHGEMTDITIRLRSQDTSAEADRYVDTDLFEESAKEIERLRKDLSQVKAQCATYRENLDKLHPRLDAKNAKIAILSSNSELVRQEGWKAGMEEAAGMVDLGFGLTDLTWDAKDQCTRLATAIRSKITDSTPTPCRGK